VGEQPRFVELYDLLKSEYVAARTLLFEFSNSERFSDANVLHFETSDMSIYGIRTEKLKAAFRIAYSLFDKIGVFINEYFDLGRAANEVNFRRVFYEKSNPRQLHADFRGRKNWPLRGLFALSKDIFDDEFREVAAPDSRMLDRFRNAAEHRYLSLHGTVELENAGDFHLKASISEFEAKTLRLLKLTRAALIYLSLAVRAEENQRAKDDPAKVIIPIVGKPTRRGRR
jgi:hypothetical protein